MLQRGWIGVVIVAGLVAGCAPKKPPATEPSPVTRPAPSLSLDEARNQLKHANSNAEIGSVVAVLSESNLAAVADLPAAHFHVGDPITFLDDTLGDLTMGVVIDTKNGRLQVRYDAPPAGHRAPQIGDFAVHIFNTLPPAPQSTAGAAASSPDAPPTAPPAPAAPAPAPPADAPAASVPAPATEPAAADSAPKPPELNK